ncbi:hypothetical protein [Nocardia sp. NBC_01388]
MSAQLEVSDQSRNRALLVLAPSLLVLIAYSVYGFADSDAEELIAPRGW